ncbi:LacI family DNA-binding transcriptional regulator [Bacteroides sp. 224]|uniref:LacI family DNA-binding transcriptional regulator n=1 Tax=Bacteroides sp. 224 TaxID=2302936 RepID=UPI0013CF7F98|nr:LacI family DNA-binding transcriptional regulator [Bacteroides sp. 224]NDV65983.1 LacI family DNA-binding transcriptional regulator [Bacteroides sp. 224]
MKSKSYRIKDIAEMAGVSIGTVDRVLHNRGDVSQESMEKVKKVLKEIDYKPNMFAIGLAAKKKYSFVCAIPYYIENDYWYTIATGIEKAAKELQPFNVNIDFVQYKHSDEASYRKVCEELREIKTDAILLAPIFEEITIELTRILDKKKTPYIFIDHNFLDTKALMYIGQNSYMSGYIAGKILMSDYEKDQEIVLFLNNNKDNPAEVQMQRRMEGFVNFLTEQCDKVTIHDVVFNKDKPEEDRISLDRFFQQHPKVKLGVVFNSRAHYIGSYLKESGNTLKSLVGYDLLKKNVELLKSGEIKYLIGQRPALQGYYGVKALCDYVVFKKEVDPIKYMPIDILMKENIDYYFELE